MAFISGALRARADIVSDTTFHNTLQVPLDRADEWSAADASPRGSRRHILALAVAVAAVAVYLGGRELIQSTIGSLPLVDAAFIGLGTVILMTVAAWRLALRDVLGAGSDEPATADAPLPVPDRFAPLDAALRRRGREPSFSAPPRVLTNPEFRQRFGTYAPHAQVELASYPELDADLDDGDDAALVERLAAALQLDARGEAADANPSLHPETAALCIPASEARLPAAIVELAAKATACAAQLELKLSTPESLPSAATREPLLRSSLGTVDAIAFQPPRVLRRMVD
jgi:hypothetical protein